MSDVANAVIVGGGMVGLATAAEIAGRLPDVFLLEKQPRFGMMTSTRNSGVIHAGIYYPPGSLKARHCVNGKALLYEFCAAHHVPHRRCGKLIVARTKDEIPALAPLAARARENGVDDLQFVDRAYLREQEPHLHAEAALWSPTSGLVDADDLVHALVREATARGASLLAGTEVIAVDPRADLVHVVTPRERVATRVLVNTAGLYADAIARMAGNSHYTIYPCRGEYAELTPRASDLVRGLVYPVPPRDGHSLGVHLTKTLGGRVLLGPTARFLDNKEDYENDRHDLKFFYDAAVRYLPALRPEDLRPSYSGIRPKLHGPDRAFEDFVLAPDPAWPRIIHAIGIESPGLTACLSIARALASLAEEALR